VSLLRPAGLVQSRRESSEDRQVSVELHPLDAPDPEGQECPFVLEAAELALDRAALMVQRLESRSRTGHERVKAD
jgi:hypothetical protein